MLTPESVASFVCMPSSFVLICPAALWRVSRLVFIFWSVAVSDAVSIPGMLISTSGAVTWSTAVTPVVSADTVVSTLDTLGRFDFAAVREFTRSVLPAACAAAIAVSRAALALSIWPFAVSIWPFAAATWLFALSTAEFTEDFAASSLLLRSAICALTFWTDVPIAGAIAVCACVCKVVRVVRIVWSCAASDCPSAISCAAGALMELSTAPESSLPSVISSLPVWASPLTCDASPDRLSRELSSCAVPAARAEEAALRSSCVLPSPSIAAYIWSIAVLTCERPVVNGFSAFAPSASFFSPAM